MILNIERVPGAVNVQTPRYQTIGSSGLDLHAAIAGPVIIRIGDRKLIPTGLAMEIPFGFEGQVRPRSGLALRHGVMAVLGTIDSDYRGEVGVLLFNAGPSFQVMPGQRIAQLVIAPVVRVRVVDQLFLSPTARGTGGFGSTGD